MSRILESLLVILSILFVLPGRASAATYYVNSTGNDSNTGTSINSAWRTINKINSFDFRGGDVINFQAGHSFVGSISFNNNDRGSTSQAITVTSYGTGMAVIQSGNAAGFTAYNTAGIVIKNLIFKGEGSSNHAKSGIEFYTDSPGNLKHEYILIKDVDISGYKNGITIGGWNGQSGYKNITIEAARIYNNVVSGITTFSQSLYGLENVTVKNSRVFEIHGINENISGGSGNGIVLGGVNNGLIERNLAYNNGELGRGCVGIWAYDSNNIKIQYNESYSNKTSGTVDGGGFDLDGGVTNSVMQYNYSHDNDGAGYGLYQYTGAPMWKNNTVRYNVSENDGRKNGFGAIMLWNGGSGLDTAYIYNNTVYSSRPPSGSTAAIKSWSATNNLLIANNIFYTAAGVYVIDIPSGQDNLRFLGNNYYSPDSSPVFRWYGTSYNGLAGWRSSSGQERLNDSSTGFSADPKLPNAGNAGTIADPYELTSLIAYKLQAGSPMINSAINLSSLGVNSGTVDFYGVTLPQDTNFDIGANEYLGNNQTTTPINVRGDANGDGRVDINDYGVWLTNYNKSITGFSNGDFAIWLINYTG